MRRLFLGVLLCTCMIFQTIQAQDAIPINPDFSVRLMLTATLTGTQLVPANDNGVLGFSALSVNGPRDEIIVNISANEAIGQITSAKIMEYNYPDPDNNFLIFDLSSSIESNRVNTVIKGVKKDQIAQMVYGNYYLELRSDNFPDGAARGELKLETDKPFVAHFNPLEGEMPDNLLSSAKAIASCGYNPGYNNLEINLFATDLSSPITGVFLHSGAEDDIEDGPVLEDLTEFVTGNRLYANVDITDYFSSVTLNGSYLKIHTEEYPNGELRGHLKLNQNLVLDGWLSEGQVVPQVNEEGINGFSMFVISGDFRTVEYWIFTDNLDEDIEALNISLAGQGENGFVFHDVTENIDGKIAYGVINSARRYFVSSLLNGDIYVDVSTESAPAGKLRGQVYRYARDGYLYTFCSNKVDDVEVSDGSGVGFLSISRKLDNSHIFFSVKNLTSPVLDIDLYKDQTFSPDSYMVGLNYLVDGAMELYWGDEDLQDPFEIEDARNIQKSDGFFVIETENYPEGELQGQIVTQLNCTNDFTNSADLDLTVTAKDAHYEQYDTTHITFEVCNKGFIAATNVVVNAPIPDGFVYCYDNGVNGEYNLYYSEWTIPFIAPGACKEFSFVALAMATGQNINYFSQIKASDQYDHDSTPGNDYDLTMNEDDEDGLTIIDLENGGSGDGDFATDLELDMTADRMEAGPYENVNYTITLKNTGADPVSYANVNITLPPGLAYTSHSSTRGKVSLYSGEWLLYNLRPNESVQLNLELFTLWPSSTIPYFIQVHATNEPDMDSTPGNVYDFIVTEDDEARVDITTTAHGMADGNTSSFAAPTYGEIYPNPATSEMNLTVQSIMDTKGTISIYSAAGKLILQEKSDFNQGFNMYNFNVSEFAAGAYFVKIPELEFASRFIKK